MACELRIIVMPVEGLDEATIGPWLAWLDEAERAKSARFVFARNRVEYTAAHVLVRHALASVTGHPASAFRFEAGAYGKPSAWIGDDRAPIHFNLSHTKGLVGVAIAPFEHGLDLEPIRPEVNLSIAKHYFSPQETAWLDGLSQARQAEGFLRLWTLKEAFIKATALGLSQPLDRFWFDVLPPAIHFADDFGEDPVEWAFEQQVIDGRFLAAIGFRRPSGTAPRIAWWQIESAAFSDALARQAPLPLRPVPRLSQGWAT